MFVKLTTVLNNEVHVNLNNVLHITSFKASSGEIVSTLTFTNGSYKNVYGVPEDFLKYPVPWIEKEPNVQRI